MPECSYGAAADCPYAAQVAAYIGDQALLNESAIRFQNCAAPLLATKANGGMISKALAACHVALTETTASNLVSFQVSSYIAALPASKQAEALGKSVYVTSALWTCYMQQPLHQVPATCLDMNCLCVSTFTAVMMCI